jgi:hypothetical protein
MEPQFQSSFIPKKSVDSGIKMVDAKSPTSLFSILTVVVVILTIVASAALFVYQRILQNQINQVQTNIVSAREAFQPDTIKQLIDVSSQISMTEKLLNSHILISQIFNILQNLTVRKISFTDFTYTSQGGVPSVTMDGESQSYNALAEQYNIFNGSGLVQNPAFSNFVLAQDGNISFTFSANIDPSAISYQNVIASSTSNQ